MPIIETEQQTNQNVISGQEYLDAGATKELVGQLRGYAEGYNDGYDAGVAAGGSSGSGGSATAYAWVNENNDVLYFNFSISPNNLQEFSSKKMLSSNTSEYALSRLEVIALSVSTSYTKTSDTSFTFTMQLDPSLPVITVTYTRDTTKDFTLWQANE